MISKKSQQTFKKTNVVYFCISFYDYDCFFCFFFLFFFFVDAVYTVYEKKNGINKENISLDYIVFVNWEIELSMYITCTFKVSTTPNK